jgi:hypothetical protein
MLASDPMIRDAVIHLFNEQPLLADLLETPLPGDVTLVCTNLRTMNRKRPIFVDHSESTFVFPYTQIRFVELPRGAEVRVDEPLALAAPSEEPEEIQLDEELLRRVREL